MLEEARKVGPLQDIELVMIAGLLIDMDEYLKTENLPHGLPRDKFRALMYRVAALAEPAMEKMKKEGCSQCPKKEECNNSCKESEQEK